VAAQGSDDVLETGVDRREGLQALAAEPHHRRESQAVFGVSKATSHSVRSFDGNGLVRRTESGYEATLSGRIVAGQPARFEGTVETACRLELLLEQVESPAVGANPDVFTDAGVNWDVEREQTPLDSGARRAVTGVWAVFSGTGGEWIAPGEPGMSDPSIMGGLPVVQT
jgi:hypothetical protein